jgi:vacuolar-type H+-ATPase subunit C/Vma6
MSIIVPSYAFTYIKIGFLKQLLIPESQITKLERTNDIKELINIIKPYFPDLEINTYTIDEIEKQLYHIYIKLIGRIISYSPENLRKFLQDFLTKYEVMNVKQVILSIILGLPRKEKRKNVNFLVQQYLDREEFMEEMVKLNSLEEVRLFLRDTRYYKPVREGILTYRNRSEIFVLESFLDQLYYKILNQERSNLNKYEKKMIRLFTKYLTEVYNIKIIYRGIINDIERKLLSQFLVESYLFLDESSTDELINQTELNGFFRLLNKFLRESEELKSIYSKISAQMEHPMWEIEKLYQKYFFKKFELKIDNIDFSTLYRIFELVIKKDREIEYIILPNVIRILHEKFNKLEEMG